MSRPTYMTIDLDALNHNLQRVRQFAPQQAVIAMVKANAYGHGIVRIAKALTKIDAFGVASLEEGLLLRQSGITCPIILMEGLFYADEIAEAENNHFTLVIHHAAHLDLLEKSLIKKPFSVWLKINTGMNRLGIPPTDFLYILKRLQKCKAVIKPVGLMTHFAEADSLDKTTTATQFKLFQQITQDIIGPRSLANSAAIIAWPATHQNQVRPGLILYGASPFPNKTGLDHDLQPVMTLSSKLIAITRVKKGEKVGYGGTWKADEDMNIGVVGVGYGDGYPQFAANGTPVAVNDHICPLVGRVSMDMLTVDLRTQPQAKIGDSVKLWGLGLPVELVAKHSNTSAYEILTRMTPRPKIEIKSAHEIIDNNMVKL